MLLFKKSKYIILHYFGGSTISKRTYVVLLDDDGSLLIKDRSPTSTGMDIDMVYTLPVEFTGAEEEVAQMCLSRKEVVFEKPKESTQHLKSLYIQGHIDGKPISKMLVDSGAVVNVIS
jgi:hypothetical protein